MKPWPTWKNPATNPPPWPWFLKNHRDVWAVGPRRRRRTRAERALAIPRSRRRPWRAPRFVLSPQCRSRALPRPDGQPGRTFSPWDVPKGKRPRRRSRPATRAGRGLSRQAVRASPPAARSGPPAAPASAETEPRTCFLKSFPPDRCGRRSTVLSITGDQLRRYAGKPGATRAARAGVAGAAAAQFARWAVVAATVVLAVGQPPHRAERPWARCCA